MVNLYEILGIAPSASEAEITRAIQRAAESGKISLENAQKAKEWLLNPNIRAKYDEKLKEEKPDFFIPKAPQQEQSVPRKNNLESSHVEQVEITSWWASVNERKVPLTALIGAVVAALLVGWFADRWYVSYKIKQVFTEGFSKTHQKSNKEQVDEDKSIQSDNVPLAWQYKTHNDEMRGRTSETATLASSNTHNLGFPYEDARGGVVIVRDEQSKLGVGNIVLFTTAQISCKPEGGMKYGTCLIAVKFDNQKHQYIIVNKDAESTDSVSVSDTDKEYFIKGVRSSNQLTVELPMYQGGKRQFIFETSGFKW